MFPFSHRICSCVERARAGGGRVQRVDGLLVVREPTRGVGSLTTNRVCRSERTAASLLHITDLSWSSQEFQPRVINKVAKGHRQKLVKSLHASSEKHINQRAAPHQPRVRPLKTEENLIAEVNKGARALGCSRQKLGLTVSTVAQTHPLLKLTRIPDGEKTPSVHDN